MKPISYPATNNPRVPEATQPFRHITNIQLRFNDVDMIGQTLMNSMSSFVGAVVMFLGSLVMMFATNAIMALSAVSSSLIGFFLMSLIVKRSQKYFISQQKSLGELNGIVEESYSNQSVIKIYNAKSRT